MQMASCASSASLKRKLRPPPEIIRFSESGLSNESRFKEARKEGHVQSQKFMKSMPQEEDKNEQNEFSGRVTSSEYSRTMHQVQGIAAELLDQKGKKSLKSLSIRLPGSKPPKNIKMPYPQLMHIRKLDKERQQKAKEDLLSQSMISNRKRKKASSEIKRGSGIGRWRDNLKSVNPPMRPVRIRNQVNGKATKVFQRRKKH